MLSMLLRASFMSILLASSVAWGQASTTATPQSQPCQAMTGILDSSPASQSPGAAANNPNSETNPGSNNKVTVYQKTSQGLLIHKVAPEYPKAAKKKRIEGTVVLAAVIDKEGNVQGLHIVCGPPELTPAALKAVKKWKYRPYYLDDKAVEVETTINVNFQLD